MGNFWIWLVASAVFGLLCASVYTWLAGAGRVRRWVRFVISFAVYSSVGLFIAGCLATVFAF